MKHFSLQRLAHSSRFLVGVSLFGIVLAGYALRVVHFDEWLYFKLDQARDAMLISDAVEKGPAYLPLLGQRVGAIDLESGLLRVGPIYYYFQYLSGVLFHSVLPPVFAYPDLFFGVAAIPMLFLFARLFFPVETSLLTTSLLAFSFIGVQYSRFAWNPNPLPFFLLLTFYGMLRFLHESEKKKKYFFLVLWALGFGVGAQLHFFGMMSLLGISGLFLLWHFELWRADAVRRVFSRSTLLPFLKYVGVATLVLLVLSAPIIANDLVRNGENTRNFFEALTKKQDSKPLTESIGKAWSENGDYFCLLTFAACTTGNEKQNRFPVALTLLFLFVGIVVAWRRFRGLPDGMNKDSFRLLFVWFGVFLVLSIPVAFQLRPRFFLVVLPIPFLLWGVLFEYAREKRKRVGLFLGLAVYGILLGANIAGISEWFAEQAASQKGNAPVTRTLILKNKDGVTLGQLQRAADLIYSRLDPGDHVYFYVKPEHIAPMDYLFEQKQKSDPNFFFEHMKINADPKARFFALVPEEQTEVEAVLKKFGRPFDILTFESVGQISVSEISFLKREKDPLFRLEKESIRATDGWVDISRRKGDRVFWGDIVGASQGFVSLDLVDSDIPDEDEE